MGRLAAVTGGRLWVFDGIAGTVRAIPSITHPAYPAWSHDGQWLAVIDRTAGHGGGGALWVGRADGTGWRSLPELGTVYGPSAFAWSPVAAALAVTVPPGGREGLWLVPAAGRPRRIAAAPHHL